MRILRRYLATEIMVATALVFAALMMLFAFFDLVEQIKDLGRGVYTMRRILIYVLLSMPDHIYVLVPGRRADRHAVRARATGGGFGIHGDANLGRVDRAPRGDARHDRLAALRR